MVPPNTGYTYFERCREPSFRFRPAATGYDPVNASWLADAALLAYADEAFARPCFEDAGLKARLIKEKGTDCYIAESPAFVIVAFRGTELPVAGAAGAFPHNLWEVVADWLTDAQVALVAGAHGHAVHAGFLAALQVVEEPLAARLQELRRAAPRRPVWFTGHSLGAALATLAAARFGPAAGVYTYGSPRVGDDAFADGYERVAPRPVRFVHGSDLVTRVPLHGRYSPLRLAAPVGDYRHVGDPWHVRDDDRVEPGEDPHSTGTLGRILSAARKARAITAAAARAVAASDAEPLPPNDLLDHAPIHYATRLFNAMAG
ncbi:MAG TPA: lipase family protein [Gemmatimonadaceae bacterium]|nr:lipase family protein [Gemmatimonadaceae bacterium]